MGNGGTNKTCNKIIEFETSGFLNCLFFVLLFAYKTGFNRLRSRWLQKPLCYHPLA